MTLIDNQLNDKPTVTYSHIFETVFKKKEGRLTNAVSGLTSVPCFLSLLSISQLTTASEFTHTSSISHDCVFLSAFTIRVIFNYLP